MSAPRKILVVIDPTTVSQPALERIARLPRPLNAQITLAIFDRDPYFEDRWELDPAAVASARASLLSGHRERLQALAAPLEAEGLEVLTDARWDHPLHEAIIRKAVEWGADLVVKDTHYHPLLRRSIFTNTDWNLIRHCPAALLLVKPRPAGHVPCVLAAVDPLHPRDEAASLDDRIVRSAEDWAETLGGRVQLFHAFDVTPIIAASAGSMTTPITLPINDLTAAMEKTHREAVHALAVAHGIPPERVRVLQGRPPDLLVACADQLRADVVVLGAVARGALERLLIGSTAEAVLDKLSCDALIVKPAGFRSTL